VIKLFSRESLSAAGVRHGPQGIPVDARLRTNVAHIYAAGDVIGGPQYSHLAGWQAFQAVRNALLPGAGAGRPRAMPQVCFTHPEIAQIGLTEQQARERHGERVRTQSVELAQVDRAVSDDDRLGLIKLVAHANGRLLGATIMGEHAGEAIAELGLALSQRLGLRELASAVHPYPTYNSAVQLLATRMALQGFLTGLRGRLVRRLARGLARRSAGP